MGLNFTDYVLKPVNSFLSPTLFVLQLYSTDCHPTDCHFCQNFGKCLNISVLNFMIKLRIKYFVFSVYIYFDPKQNHYMPALVIQSKNQNYGVLIWLLIWGYHHNSSKIFNFSYIIHGYWSNTYWTQRLEMISILFCC